MFHDEIKIINNTELKKPAEGKLHARQY